MISSPFSSPSRVTGSLKKTQTQNIRETPEHTVSTSKLECAKSVLATLPNQREEKLLRQLLKTEPKRDGRGRSDCHSLLTDNRQTFVGWRFPCQEPGNFPQVLVWKPLVHEGHEGHPGASATGPAEMGACCTHSSLDNSTQVS